MPKKKVLVVGAGASGLASIKSCLEGGLETVCYEKKGVLGGLWRFREADNESSVMRFTISNTSKEMSAFSDFPAPDDWPTYLHHTLVVRYLELYADHFDLLSKIHYYQEVFELLPAEDYGSTGRWLAKVRDLRSEEVREEYYEGVMACVGHHSDPSRPAYPGLELFSGRLLHSSQYKCSDGMEDQVVLVLGAGNSGVDVATDASNVAKKVFLSTRRGSWIYPRLYDKGKPFDACAKRRSQILLPNQYQASRLKKKLNDKMDHKRYGLQPYHHISSQHPTVSDELPAKLLHGSVSIRRDVKEFSQKGVLFDGDEHFTEVDVVVFATGFNVRFPFLTDDILRVGKNNKLSLYKHVFPPTLMHHTLGVIGLVQGNGSLFPLFEIQARWFVALMNGRCRLPPAEDMLSRLRAAEGERARTYVQSPRHTHEVSWIPYMDSVAVEFGVKPNLMSLLVRDPKLFRACFFGPCLPYQYRLSGPHKWVGAKEAILNYKERMFGHMMEGSRK